MILRAFAPADRDWLIDRHRVLYGAEFGFAPDFGDSIAMKLDAFLARPDPMKRRWITETDLGWHRFGQSFDREIWQAQL
jgi:hypothetical protein